MRVFFFKQKTAYDIVSRDWSSDVCSSDLDREACCGFGGTFCLKYSEISESMVDTKIDNLLASGADTLAAGDLGCLMNMAGKLQRRGSKMQVRHVAEVLADMTDQPAIGESADERARRKA